MSVEQVAPIMLQRAEDWDESKEAFTKLEQEHADDTRKTMKVLVYN